MVDKTKNQQIKLHDGRMLGYAEYGAPEGVPVFYFHGFFGSRLDYLLSDSGAGAAEANARIIAVDRPGMGLSDFQRDRQMLDWPDDVDELADTLRIDRFAVLGVSGGGPYAAACAFKISGRLTRAGIVCGMGPADAPGAKDGISWTIPGKIAPVRWIILQMTAMGLRRDPDRFVTKSNEVFPEPDRKLLGQPEVAKLYIEGLQEAFRSGTGGATQEAVLYGRPWGFRLEEIAAEVYLWHGEKDLNVPVSVGRHVTGAIPGCQATFFEQEAHLTLPHNKMGEILSTLV